MKRFGIGILVSGLLLSCGQKSPPANQPSPVVSPRVVESLSPPTPIGNESYDLVSVSLASLSGWKTDIVDPDRERVIPVGNATALFAQLKFHPGVSPRCLWASAALHRAAVFSDSKMGTVEWTIRVEPFSADLEYWIRFEANIGGLRRLVQWNPRSVRTFQGLESVDIAGASVPPPGRHVVRIVAEGSLTALYIDGKPLGEFRPGGVSGGAPGEVVAQLTLPERVPAASAALCGSGTLYLEKLEASSKPYYLP